MFKSVLTHILSVTICFSGIHAGTITHIKKSEEITITPYIQQQIDALTIQELFDLVMPYSWATYYAQSDMDDKREILYKAVIADYITIVYNEDIKNVNLYLYKATYQRAQSLSKQEQQLALLNNVPKPEMETFCDLSDSKKQLLELYVSSLSFDDCIIELIYSWYNKRLKDGDLAEFDTTSKVNEICKWFDLFTPICAYKPIFAYKILYNALITRVHTEGSQAEKALAAFLMPPKKVADYLHTIGSGF